MQFRKLKPATGTAKDPVSFIRPKKEPPLPSKGVMMANAAKSLLKTAAATLKGNPKLTKEEAAARLAICNSCEFFRHSDQRCGKCGCYMAIKTYLKSEKCPVNRW